jgi:hypothetical protein
MADAPWFALNIDYWRNPKVARAGFLAGSLNIAALAYCAEQLTDGFVPTGVVHILAAPMQDYVYDPGLPKGALAGPGPEHEDGYDLALRLEQAGLWEAVPGGWQIVHYLDHQPSREQVLARREQAREAGRQGGLKRSANRTAKQNASEPLSESLANPQAESKQTSSASPSEIQAPAPAPRPLPTPELLPEVKPSSSSHGDDAPTSFAEFWSIYPRKVGKKAAAKAYRSALKTTDAETVIKGASRFRADPNREDQFTPHPATWLNQGRWDDEPLPSRLRAVDSRAAQGDEQLRRWMDQARPTPGEIA